MRPENAAVEEILTVSAPTGDGANVFRLGSAQAASSAGKIKIYRMGPVYGQKACTATTRPAIFPANPGGKKCST
jgi:hypothetical protein